MFSSRAARTGLGAQRRSRFLTTDIEWCFTPDRRTKSIGKLISRVGGIAVGDLRGAAETKSIADQVNAIARMDAVVVAAASPFSSDYGPCSALVK